MKSLFVAAVISTIGMASADETQAGYHGCWAALNINSFVRAYVKSDSTSGVGLDYFPVLQPGDSDEDYFSL